MVPFYEWSFPNLIPNGINMNLTFINFCILVQALRLKVNANLQWTKKQQENTFIKVHFANVFNTTP
jgi:hypothetical protein